MKHLTESAVYAAALEGAPPAHAATCPDCERRIAAAREIVESVRADREVPADLLQGAAVFYERQRALESLVERLAVDPALRAKLRSRPDAVLRKAGLPVSEEIVRMLASEQPARTQEPEQRLAARRLWR